MGEGYKSEVGAIKSGRKKQEEGIWWYSHGVDATSTPHPMNH